MGNPDRAGSRSVRVKPSDVCLKRSPDKSPVSSRLATLRLGPGLEGRLTDWVPGQGRRVTVPEARKGPDLVRLWCLAEASCREGVRRGPGWGSRNAHPRVFAQGSPGSQLATGVQEARLLGG